MPFSSALERDTAYTSKQVDGVLNDFVSATALNRERDFTRNVRVILRSTQELSLFALLASKDSDIEKIEDVKGKQIAISPNTIIEYVLDRMLGTVGLGHDDVEKVAVPSIPLRLEMLEPGQRDRCRTAGTTRQPEHYGRLARALSGMMPRPNSAPHFSRSVAMSLRARKISCAALWMVSRPA